MLLMFYNGTLQCILVVYFYGTLVKGDFGLGQVDSNKTYFWSKF